MSNWLNDPNGLVYNAGEYYLFYQQHPLQSKLGSDALGSCCKS